MSAVVTAHLCESCLPSGALDDFYNEASLLSTFKYLEQHASFYSTMLTNKGVPAFRNRLLTMALQSLNNQIDINGLKKGVNKEILAQFMASAIVGVLEWWMTHAMPYPATVMVEQFSLLLEIFQQTQQPQV